MQRMFFDPFGSFDQIEVVGERQEARCGWERSRERERSASHPFICSLICSLICSPQVPSSSDLPRFHLLYESRG